MILLLGLVAWVIAGIVSVAKVISKHESYGSGKNDGPVMNFMDKINRNSSDTVFTGSLITLIILSVTLWPFVLIYQFATHNQVSRETVNQSSAQPQ